MTLVTITHDMSLAFQIADRIAMIRQGRIIAIDPPELFADNRDPWVRAFLEGEVPSEVEDEP